MMSDSLKTTARGFVFLASLTLLLAASTGFSCDTTAQTDFKNTAASAVGDGIKTIVSGLIDGTVAAIKTDTSSSSSSSGNGT